MGLSASQARLLSITARLTDNEYHSQQIANAKMRLAAKGTEARQEYQDALNSSVLVYNGFDKQGNSTTTVFTPNVIYQYQPLKNQYALINNSGQILVNNTDAKNFEETNTLGEFLARYDAVTTTEIPRKKIVIEEHKVLNNQYYEDWEKYNADKARWYEEVWKPWKENDGKIKEIKPGWTKRIHNSPIYQAVLNASSCMTGSLDGKNCYMHVLADLLGPDHYKTSYNNPETGQPYEFDITGNCTEESHNPDKSGGWCWHVHHSSHADIPQSLRDQLMTQLVPEHELGEEATVDIEYQGTVHKGIRTKCDEYCVPGMTLQQKIIDLLWKVHEDYVLGDAYGGPADPDHLAEFFHFIEFDLDEATEVEIPGETIYYNDPEPVFDGEVPTTEKYTVERVKKEVDDPLYEYEVADREKCQWYTNLWYRMNGYEEPERIQTKEGYEDNMDYYRKYLLKTLNSTKDTFANGYQVLDSHLASSTTWLEDVLSQGIVVMQRVNSHTIETQKKFSWDNIIYTDASELTIETDDNAIAKAEVVYEEKMREIETKDKRYQMEINKLDSEHNSLQTQIDSIKSEVSKNIERSYKTFG